jgi:hypothetical protein
MQEEVIRFDISKVLAEFLLLRVLLVLLILVIGGGDEVIIHLLGLHLRVNLLRGSLVMGLMKVLLLLLSRYFNFFN